MLLYFILIIESSLAAFCFGYLLFFDIYKFISPYQSDGCRSALISCLEHSYDESFHMFSGNYKDCLYYYDNIQYLDGLLTYKYKYTNIQRYIFHPFIFIAIPHFIMCIFLFNITSISPSSVMSIVFLVVIVISLFLGLNFSPFRYSTNFETFEKEAQQEESWQNFNDKNLSHLFIVYKIRLNYASYLDNILSDLKIHKYCMIYVPISYFLITCINCAILYFF